MELLGIINFIILIYLLVTVNKLQKIVRSKTREVEILPQQKDQQTNEAPVYKQTNKNVWNEDSEDVMQKFFTWFARDWPLKVGALFILLGFIWLVTYAFLNNWIGPIGRIIIGILSGSAILIWGSTQIKKNVYQGEILTGLGAGIVLVSISSAQYIYNNMFPPAVALALSTMVAGMVAFVSYRNNTVRLAVLGYLIGAIAPMLTGASSPSVLGLFSYLFCLTVATIWLVRLTGWRLLMIIAVLVVWFYSLPWLSLYISPTNLIYMRFFAITFTIIFYFFSFSSYIYDRTAKAEDSIVSTLIGLYAFHWILALVPHEYQSLVCVVFAVVFMSGSYFIFHTHELKYPVFLYTGVSIVFLVTATILQFKGNILPLVLVTEALALVIFADTIYGPRMVKWMSALFIPPILYSLPMLIIFTSLENSGTLIYINFALYVCGYYLMRFSKINTEEIRSLSKILITAAGVFSIIYLWVSMPYYFGYKVNLYSFYNESPENYQSIMNARANAENILFAAHAVTLTLFTIIGISLYMYGLKESHKWTKRFGLILTCFVIGRLLLVEVWSMSLAARIITFFIIGIIFIASVFVRRSNHETQ